MSTSSDSAEQIVRLSLEGVEVVAKISGVAAKNIAVALYTIMNNKQGKTKGKARLNTMLRTEKDIKIFSIKSEDLKTFYKEAKSYGILYCALINRRNKDLDGAVDIMVRATDAPKINRIIERYNLGIYDKATIESNIEQEKNINKGKDISEKAPDIGEKKPSVSDNDIDNIFAMPNSKKEQENQNPMAAKTEKNPSPPSEHSLKSKNNSEGVSKTVEKKSVREELKEIVAGQKIDTELKKAQNVKDNGNTIIIPNNNMKINNERKR
jgi:hypothetical protein